MLEENASFETNNKISYRFFFKKKKKRKNTIILNVHSVRMQLLGGKPF